LEVKNQFETNKAVIPIFISTESTQFTAFAQNVWDKLIQENDYFDCIGVLPVDESKKVFRDISAKAEELLLTKFEEFEKNISANTEKIRLNKEKSFAFQEKQMNRIGIENIKQSRLSRLHREIELWNNNFHSAKQIVPELTCLLLMKIENE
jgi:hypothetical protein